MKKQIRLNEEGMRSRVRKIVESTLTEAFKDDALVKKIIDGKGLATNALDARNIGKTLDYPLSDAHYAGNLPEDVIRKIRSISPELYNVMSDYLLKTNSGDYIVLRTPLDQKAKDSLYKGGASDGDMMKSFISNPDRKAQDDYIRKIGSREDNKNGKGAGEYYTNVISSPKSLGFNTRKKSGTGYHKDDSPF